MLALPRDVCRVCHGVCTVPGAGDSAKSRLTRKMWSVMESDPYTPRDGQDVQAIRSAAAETLLKVALGLSVRLWTLRRIEALGDLERALAGRLRKTADWRRCPRTRCCPRALFRHSLALGFAWAQGPRPNALNFHSGCFQTVVTPNPKSRALACPKLQLEIEQHKALSSPRLSPARAQTLGSSAFGG